MRLSAAIIPKDKAVAVTPASAGKGQLLLPHSLAPALAATPREHESFVSRGVGTDIGKAQSARY